MFAMCDISGCRVEVVRLELLALGVTLVLALVMMLVAKKFDLICQYAIKCFEKFIIEKQKQKKPKTTTNFQQLCLLTNPYKKFFCHSY